MEVYWFFFFCCIQLIFGVDNGAFPFTECDHVFDSSRPRGYFSFPILSNAPNSRIATVSEKGVILPDNIQCIYTFVAGEGERIKLEFTHFQLSGTLDNCDLEYVDLYWELESAEQDLLTSPLGSRFCGTVAPHVRVSLHNIMVLVFHSRVGKRRSERFRLNGRYQFISEARYIPGSRIGESKCGFLIEPIKQRNGQIVSPTYPGTYPSHFYCFYLLKGNDGDRIRLYFRDFDVYFGGEHCPYDAMTIYDGNSNKGQIIRKVCGLQQRLELFSFGSDLLLEFNTTDPAKSEPRGFIVEYEFSDSFVDVKRLIGGQKGVSHMRGSECDVRIQSNRETVHFIQSPNFPDMYPQNTTCTYVLDGLQGDQNLEKVILTFETFVVPNELPSSSEQKSALEYEGDDCYSFVGVALKESSIKAVLANNEESFYDATLCDHIPKGNPKLGPYTSQGPRMVLVFGSGMASSTLQPPFGFRARIEFKTDFGVPGEPMGGSNECRFRFTEKRGSFNSPRYPANYPLDTNCTYLIKGEPGEQILLYFEQFALFEEPSKEDCNDWLEIFDIFTEANGTSIKKLQARHCWTVFPGPTTSVFGANEMLIIFNSDSKGTANGFNALYEIRKAFKEPASLIEGSDKSHCGMVIRATSDVTSGWFSSPGYPVKYSQNQICDWEIIARPSRQVLLQLNFMDVEGEMTETKVSCKNAVIRIHRDDADRTADQNICGTNYAVIAPLISANNSIRISFLTAPDKVNGLRGFNFTWTEVRVVQQDSECADSATQYLCSYTRLCIDARLRCNGDDNCGQNDDTDEAHCNIDEKATDMRTIIFAAVFCGCIFIFILSFFFIMFKKKCENLLNRKRRHMPRPVENGSQHRKTALQKKNSKTENRTRQRQPFRQQQPQRIATISDNGVSVTEKHQLSQRISNAQSVHFESPTTTISEHTFYG